MQRWRQPPGPRNALGQMKFVMPNSKAIYLHDTNARSRFNSQVRALSHGCIRTQNITTSPRSWAATMAGSGRAIGSTRCWRRTRRSRPIREAGAVYIVYFSQAALLDGKIVDYKDLYGRDSKAMAAMQMKDGGASLTVPKKPERRRMRQTCCEGRFQKLASAPADECAQEATSALLKRFTVGVRTGRWPRRDRARPKWRLS